MNICVIIGWRRPEFLTLTLKHIQDAEGSEDLFYLFCLDNKFDKTNIAVIRTFPYQHAILEMPRTQYKLGKQSYNVLNGLMAAAAKTEDLVYFIEDDIFVAKDFFKYHQSVHKQQDVPISIGTRNNNTQWKVTNEKGAYYISNTYDYQSLGNCFKKSFIHDYIGPNFVESYFFNPVAYCRAHFPHSFIGEHFAEQDGLIRRIIEKNDLKVAFPHVPRGFHAGFYGYNRKAVRVYGYNKKLDFIKKVCYDRDAMKKICGEYWRDSIPQDLTINENKFYLKQVGHE